MVAKKILFLILTLIVLVGCENKYNINTQENTVIEETKYEYMDGKYFVIKKINDNKYSFYSEEDISIYFHTKTSRGFIFSYDFYIDDKGNYQDWYCHFDESTNTVEKILDASSSYYEYSTELENRVILFTTMGENTVEIFDLSENGARKIIDIEGAYSFRYANFSKESFLIWYEDNGKLKLKNINYEDGVIKDINIEDEGGSSYRYGDEEGSYRRSIIAAYRDRDNIYYCLAKTEDDGNIKFKLVAHSISKRKDIYSMDVPKGLCRMIVKDNIFIFAEMCEDGSIPSPDAFIMKKVGNELKEIAPIRYANNIFSHSLNKNYLLVGMVEGYVCKVNLRNFERDYIKVEKGTRELPRVTLQNIIGDKIVVLTKKENESIFELWDFNSLKEKNIKVN